MSSYRADGPEELKPLGETDFVLKATADGGKPHIAAGIVAFANFKLGDRVAPVIEAHLAAAGKRLCGLRYTTAWDPSPLIRPYMNSPKGLLLDPQFRKGFGHLKKYGLTFDAAVLYHQLPEVIDLAWAFPDTPIVIDHVACPIVVGPYEGKRDEVLADWRRLIAQAGECPNLYMKLGGLGLPLSGFGWHMRDAQPGSRELAAAMKPYFLYCIEHFGVSRCMLESNFPEDRVSFSYSTMWNAFKLITKGFSPTERAALFHDTAVQVYGI